MKVEMIDGKIFVPLNEYDKLKSENQNLVGSLIQMEEQKLKAQEELKAEQETFDFFTEKYNRLLAHSQKLQKTNIELNKKVGGLRPTFIIYDDAVGVKDIHQAEPGVYHATWTQPLFVNPECKNELCHHHDYIDDLRWVIEMGVAKHYMMQAEEEKEKCQKN